MPFVALTASTSGRLVGLLVILLAATMLSARPAESAALGKAVSNALVK